MKKKDAVIVLGMHRSGTSCMAELLVAMGLNPGDKTKLLAPTKYNPRGYFENHSVVEANEKFLANKLRRFLARLDIPWDECFEGQAWLFAPWLLDECVDQKVEAQEIVKSVVDKIPQGDGCLVLKDPRLSLTLDYWVDCLNVKAVITMIRNPSDVVLSLQRRDGLDPIFSEKVCGVYTDTAINISKSHPNLIVDYDQLLKGSECVITNIHRFLFEQGVVVDSLDLKKVSAVVRGDLNHGVGGVDVAIHDGGLPACKNNLASKSNGVDLGFLLYVIEVLKENKKDKRNKENINNLKLIIDRLNKHPVAGAVIHLLRKIKRDDTFGEY